MASEDGSQSELGAHDSGLSVLNAGMASEDGSHDDSTRGEMF